MLLLVGQVARGDARPRGLPGGRLRGDVRRRWRSGSCEVDVRRADPGAASRAPSRRDLGPARPGRAGAAGGRARGGGRRRPTRRRVEPAQAHPGRRRARRARASCSAGASGPLVLVGGRPWSAAAADDLLAFCEASALPVAPSFRCQDYVDNALAVVRRPPRHRARPAARAARARGRRARSSSARRLGDITTGGYTLRRAAASRGRRSIHVHRRTRRSSVASTGPTLGDRRGRARVRGALARARAGRRRPLARRGPRPPAPTTSTTSATRRCPARSTWAR